MFGVGLHFSIKDLMAVRKIALPGAILQIAVATAMGIALAHWWGWSLSAGLAFGLALSVASTVVLLRALEDRGILDSLNGRIAVGWLVVEDLVTVLVLVLVLLPALSGALGGTGGQSGAALWQTLAITLGQVAAFVAFMLIVGHWPRGATCFNKSIHYWPGIYKLVSRPGFVAVYLNAHGARIIPNRVCSDRQQRSVFIASIQRRLMKWPLHPPGA